MSVQMQVKLDTPYCSHPVPESDEKVQVRAHEGTLSVGTAGAAVSVPDWARTSEMSEGRAKKARMAGVGGKSEGESERRGAAEGRKRVNED